MSPREWLGRVADEISIRWLLLRHWYWHRKASFVRWRAAAPQRRQAAWTRRNRYMRIGEVKRDTWPTSDQRDSVAVSRNIQAEGKR